MNTVVLTGLKHCGKSSQSESLAEHYGLQRYDLDEEISKMHGGGAIRELYREHGPAWFKHQEIAALENIPDLGAVVSCGGGSMENRELMAKIRARGMAVFFIDTSEDVLFERIIKKGIPPFLDADDPRASFNRLYPRRRALARHDADIIIDAGSLQREDVLQILIRNIDDMERSM